MSRTTLAAGAALLAMAGAVSAADHAEAPGSRADAAADIADVYAWHDGNSLIGIITFDGLRTPGQPVDVDEGVLYTLNIDNDGDLMPDISVECRFVEDVRGNQGIRVVNLPGSPDPIVGFLDSTIDASGRPRVFAGLVDDPFFFDLEGFRNTLATGTLSFDGTRDSFAGLNVLAIALRMDLDAALDGGSTLNVWATTAR